MYTYVIMKKSLNGPKIGLILPMENIIIDHI